MAGAQHEIQNWGGNIPLGMPPHQEAFRATQRWAYEQARSLVFGVERSNPGDSHRLTLGDLNQLRRYGDGDLIEALEHTIVLHRLGNLIVNNLLGSVSEGAVAYTSAARLGGSPHPLIHIVDKLAILGMFANDFARQLISSDVKEEVGDLLTQVLRDIAKKYTADAKLLSLGDLSYWADNVASRVADAEQFSPLSLEMIPPAISISTGLLAQEQILPTLIFLAFNVASSFPLHLALKKTDSPILGKLYRKVSHLIASLAKYGPVLASLTNNQLSEAHLNTIVVTLGCSHLAILPEHVDEFSGGREALAEMREVLKNLGLSLASPELQGAHHNRILSTRDPASFSGHTDYDPTKSNIVWRYNLVDKAIQAEHGDNIPPGNFAYFHDYSFRLGNRVFLDNASLLLEGGQVHQLIGTDRSGRSASLRALSDELNHQKGLSFIRLTDGDHEVHEVGLPAVALHQCGNIEDSYIPFFNGVPEIANLEQSKMFTPSEIAIFYDHYNYGFRNQDVENLTPMSASLRTRLKIAEAFMVAHRAPVHFFDDPFAKLNPEEVNRVALFLSRMAKKWGYVILTTQRSAHPIAADIFKQEAAFGKVLQIREGEFEKIITSRTTLPESFWQWGQPHSTLLHRPPLKL
ncbi:hypothetical protein A2960_03050 [Candidatus Gottesmanbacteria bacterium RIFCSPLOWO2_01_FULL_39_12b]|uniref:ABC transporter domain-containing protein n=1 Tax=Candidatus Gottesmanbacteria bacterium RIFCSPLOWO2_01_FULL_39_12b TaxID=1798388 RepID=A0A1F6ARH5_9BACT|nr:MAG: hypothetical protein A2960_03050 [Candidatus Gottesmanbacteria bacterium RIFCSPLOWO2_01_FULL_39_12b]